MGGIRISIHSKLPVITEGIKKILELENYIFIGNCSDICFNTLNFIHKREIDVLIIDDTSFGEKEFYNFINNLLKLPIGTRTLVYSNKYDSQYFKSLVYIGIRSILHMEAKKEKLIDALTLVSNGGCYFDNFISSTIFKTNCFNKLTNDNNLAVISKREKQVLKLMSIGMRNKEIAEKLFISCRTVEVHKANIVKKFDLKSGAELIKYVLTRLKDIEL